MLVANPCGEGLRIGGAIDVGDWRQPWSMSMSMGQGSKGSLGCDFCFCDSSRWHIHVDP
jgi:hypothetical protein